MTKAQQTYERVEALMAEGTARADVFKTLAEEYGQSVDSVRGAYYTGRKQATGTVTPRSARGPRETTAEDAIAAAVAAMRQAIDSIEVELAAAKNRAEQSQLLYEGLRASAGERIAAIESKIAALEADPTKEATAKAKAS